MPTKTDASQSWVGTGDSNRAGHRVLCPTDDLPVVPVDHRAFRLDSNRAQRRRTLIAPSHNGLHRGVRVTRGQRRSHARSFEVTETATYVLAVVPRCEEPVLSCRTLVRCLTV